jgi:hypothetical protein
MEINIGLDAGDGIKISIFSRLGEAIVIEQIGDGILTVGEARLAADLLKVVADHLEASNDGN